MNSASNSNDHVEVSFLVIADARRLDIIGYVVLAHEQVKVPLLASMPLQILKVEVTFDRVMEMVYQN
jgi:hypothetical protein